MTSRRGRARPRTWHFAFHTVLDLPEALLTGREREFLEWFLRNAANPQVPRTC